MWWRREWTYIEDKEDKSLFMFVIQSSPLFKWIPSQWPQSAEMFLLENASSWMTKVTSTQTENTSFIYVVDIVDPDYMRHDADQANTAGSSSKFFNDNVCLGKWLSCVVWTYLKVFNLYDIGVGVIWNFEKKEQRMISCPLPRKNYEFDWLWSVVEVVCVVHYLG